MVMLYYTFINDFDINVDISNFNLERKEYVNSILDVKRKSQSIIAWKLLEYALNKNGFVNTNFTQKNGKWVEINGKINLSITHSNKLIAIAISTSNLLAIDCEIMCDRKAVKDYKNKIFNKNVCTLENFYEEWTKKECFYKLGENFVANELNEIHYVIKRATENYALCALYNKNLNLDIEEIDINLLKD
ncbi:MAG: hypothetical protein IKW33_05210 [Clostridia bacterium]|nr:hypothetical protein [Clostridia bacterium]